MFRFQCTRAVKARPCRRRAAATTARRAAAATPRHEPPHELGLQQCRPIRPGQCPVQVREGQRDR